MFPKFNERDIFIRNSVFYCDGIRGNICSGTNKDKIITFKYKSCPECFTCKYGEKECVKLPYNWYYLCKKEYKRSSPGLYDMHKGDLWCKASICNNGECKTPVNCVYCSKWNKEGNYCTIKGLKCGLWIKITSKRNSPKYEIERKYPECT